MLSQKELARSLMNVGIHHGRDCEVQKIPNEEHYITFVKRKFD